MADERRPDDESKRDLRYTDKQEDNVRIERNLDGSGHLARGDKTKMSVLNFSSRHPARTERDPDFAFRPAPAPKPVPPPEPVAAAPTPTPAPEPAAAPAAATEPSVLDKIKKVFGL